MIRSSRVGGSKSPHWRRIAIPDLFWALWLRSRGAHNLRPRPHRRSPSGWDLCRTHPEGGEAAGLPVMEPTKFEQVIYLETAKAFRLTMSPSILALTDEVDRIRFPG